MRKKLSAWQVRVKLCKVQKNERWKRSFENDLEEEEKVKMDNKAKPVGLYGL